MLPEILHQEARKFSFGMSVCCITIWRFLTLVILNHQTKHTLQSPLFYVQLWVQLNDRPKKKMIRRFRYFAKTGTKPGFLAFKILMQQTACYKIKAHPTIKLQPNWQAVFYRNWLGL